MPDSEYHRALQRYARLRRLAYDLAERLAAPASGSIRLTDIDAQALDVWRATWDRAHPLGYGGWDWSGLVERISRRPSAFQVAIWSGEQLCGLAVGRVSRRRASGRRHTLSVHFLEGNPHREHPLRGRVAEIAIAAAEAYADGLGAWRVRLIDPLPGVFRTYQRLGFTIARESASRLYFEKRIDRHGLFRVQPPPRGNSAALRSPFR
jgi:hypothetical protein